jgi:hypothetical protein
MFGWVSATGVFLGIAGVLTYVTISAAAAEHDAAQNIGAAARVQQLMVEFDGAMASDIEALIAGPIADGIPAFAGVNSPFEEYDFDARPGSTLAYIVNADRTHFVIVERQPNGGVVAASDEHAAPVICTSGYTSDCIARLTSDESLLTVSPEWRQF